MADSSKTEKGTQASDSKPEGDGTLLLAVKLVFRALALVSHVVLRLQTTANLHSSQLFKTQSYLHGSLGSQTFLQAPTYFIHVQNPRTDHVEVAGAYAEGVRGGSDEPPLGAR